MSGFLENIDNFLIVLIRNVFPKNIKGKENLQILKTLTEEQEKLHPSTCFVFCLYVCT